MIAAVPAQTRTAGALGYMPALDGLRAFAALVFFVLSGFLITNIRADPGVRAARAQRKTAA